jgi:hypothetical protein
MDQELLYHAAMRGILVLALGAFGCGEVVNSEPGEPDARSGPRPDGSPPGTPDAAFDAASAPDASAPDAAPGPVVCDNGTGPDAPYSGCGTYDASNQIVCYCNHGAQRTSEAFFESMSNLDHWLDVYPSTNVVYTGPTPYTNTLPYVIRYTY